MYKPKYFCHAVFLLILSFLYPLQRIEGINFVPVITNISSLDYNGGLQNWSITQDDKGVMHFGNNTGMLTYDGYNWTLSRLPNGSIVRSVLADGDRIYVGSYEDFGYFERTAMGSYAYTSLWKLIRGYQSHNDEIWKIIKTSNGHVIFQSFCSWFEYDGSHVSVHYNARHLPLYFFDVGGHILVQIINGDLCQLQAGRYRPFLKREQFGNDNVVTICPLSGKRLLMMTERHGLFIWNHGRLTPLPTAIDSALKTQQINRGLVTHDGKTIVVGTILDGIYGLDLDGTLRWHYSTANHLQNNTVLNLFCDHLNNVWAALDIGIALIHYGSPYTLLSGPIGMVYGVLPLPGHQSMYLATNQNTLLYNNGSFTNVSGTEGQNWHISQLNNQIVVGNNHGNLIINGTQSTPIDRTISSSSTSIKRYTINDEHDYLIESTYTQLLVYRHVSGRWIFQNAVEGFMAPVRQMEIDSHGVIWAANMNHGCYRIELSGDLHKILHITKITRLGDEEGGIHVMKIRGEVVLSNGHHLYTSDNLTKPFLALDGLINDDVTSATMVDNNHFWLATTKGYQYFSYANGHFLKLLDVPARFFGLECSDNLNTVCVNGRYTYFCMNGGVGRMDMSFRTVSPTIRPRLFLREAHYIDADSIHYVKLTGGTPEVNGNLFVRMGYANYNNAPIKFVFKLKGNGEDATQTTRKPEASFGNLAYGHYQLDCTVVDALGRELDTISWQFSNPRPLLLTYPMILLYITMASLFVYAYIKWHTRKIIRQHLRKMETERMKQKIAYMQQQHDEESKQKEQLEEDLRDKGKEIASMALGAVAYSKKDKDEYWRLFHENFDLIHKAFFRHLREQYPQLTPNDLRLCAYLRLNMTTKDIARQSGLSVRGVEGARYRLRKKLGLSENQDLVAFLIDFK